MMCTVYLKMVQQKVQAYMWVYNTYCTSLKKKIDENQVAFYNTPINASSRG